MGRDNLSIMSFLGRLCSFGLLIGLSMALWFTTTSVWPPCDVPGAVDGRDDGSLGWEQQPRGRRVCLGVLTAGRTDLNEESLRTIQEAVGPSAFFRKVIIDDSRNLNTTKLLVDTFGPQGFRVFRTNHPPKIEREFKISLNIWTLYALMNPNLVSETAWGQVTAYRQKFGGEGGEFNPGPMGFEAKAGGSEEVVERSLIWPSTPNGGDAVNDKDCDYVLHSEGDWGYIRENFLQVMVALHENVTRDLNIGALANTLGNSTAKYKDHPERAGYLSGVKLTPCLKQNCKEHPNSSGQLLDTWRSWSNQPGLVNPKVMLMDNMTRLAFLSEGRRAGAMHKMGYFMYELGRERTCSCQLDHLGHGQSTNKRLNPKLHQVTPPQL